MKILLRTEPKGKQTEIEAVKGTTAEQIYRKYGGDLPYQIVAARVNNRFVALDYALQRSCSLELLDMRTQAANLIYQYSLSMIYLKAVDDVFGDVPCEIMNSLNKGLYTEIHTGKEITEAQVRRIESRMRELVDADLPFRKNIVSRRTALKYLKQDKRFERRSLIQSAKELKRVKFYDLDGYRDFYYGQMVPSTGYVRLFELRRYRRGVLLRFPQQADPSVIPPYVDETKLYRAFEEQTEWDSLLGVNYVSELNEKIDRGESRELIQLSEALHEKKIAQIADMIKKQKKRIILIAGPSSSGKTTFAMRLCIQLRVNGLRPLYLGTDDYFVEREETPRGADGEYDFENLDAIDIKLFNDNMNDLLAGREVDMPTFDFMTGHKKFGTRLIRIKGDQPIVIEGIHGLNEKLTEFIPQEQKFRIYISPLTQLNIDIHNRIPTTDERMLRRLVRDYRYRGHSARSTIASWPKVRAGEDRNIFPYSGSADVLFNSYHVYEIAVLRKYAEPLLRRIRPSEPEYAEARRMLQFLEFFSVIEDDSAIVNNSILREFIGGSIFVS